MLADGSVDRDVLACCAVAFEDVGSSVGVPSTVIDLRPLAAGADPVVLREGAVPGAEALRSVAAAIAKHASVETRG